MTELFTAPLKFYNLSEFAACCLEPPAHEKESAIEKVTQI